MEVQGSNQTVASSPDYERDIGDEIEGAGFWIRVLARIIDLVVHNVVGLFVIIPLAVIVGIVGTIMGTPIDELTAKLESQPFLTIVLGVLGSTMYHAVSEGFHGSTLGKLICGLVVVKQKGVPCGFFAALGRSFAFYIDAFFFGVPAAISMADTSKRERLGDRWAKTMVVKRSDLKGIMEVRSGLWFVLVFFGAALVDGIFFGIGQILKFIG